MKRYQVTRKFQVTIPKRIAENVSIKPGDSVLFEERDDGILIKKINEVTGSPEELRSVITNFVKDISHVRPHVKKARLAIIENLSRNISTK